MARFAGADIMLVAWGIVWLLGYLGTQFIPSIVIASGKSGALIWVLISSWWTVLIVAGVWCTVVAIRRHSPTVSTGASNVGILWGLLYIYSYVFVFLFGPFVQISPDQELPFYRHIGAATAIIPMLAYAIMGAVYDRYLLWTGLGVTALTLLGLVTMGNWFYLWMALVGGGTLIAVGLFIGRKWRTA